MGISTKLSLGLIALSSITVIATPGFAQGDSSSTNQITKTDTSSSSLAKNKRSSSNNTFRGVSFKNANKIEFKYKERIKNFKEQLQMGIKKGWLSDQEVAEFRKKIQVLEKLEAKVSAKNYPKLELDQMEKIFTLYNQEFYKASNTPMSKKTSVQKASSNKTVSTEKKDKTKCKTTKKKQGSK